MSLPIVGQGDIGVNLNFTVRDTSGKIVDLTGATASLVVVPMVDIGLGNVKSYSANISDATNGGVTYTTTGNEFPNGDCKYILQVLVNFPDGRQYTSTVVRIMIRANISKILTPYATQGINLL